MTNRRLVALASVTAAATLALCARPSDQVNPGATAARPSTDENRRTTDDQRPATKRTYGEGLPRDADRLIFADSQYPNWPLVTGQQQYAPIDGARMKRQVVDLGQIAVRYRDAGHK